MTTEDKAPEKLLGSQISGKRREREKERKKEKIKEGYGQQNAQT